MIYFLVTYVRRFFVEWEQSWCDKDIEIKAEISMNVLVRGLSVRGNNAAGLGPRRDPRIIITFNVLLRYLRDY